MRPGLKSSLRPLDNEKGTTMTEYALLCCLLAIVCLTGISSLGRGASVALADSGGAIGCAGEPAYGAWVCHHCDDRACYYRDGGGTWGTDPGPLGGGGDYIRFPR